MPDQEIINGLGGTMAVSRALGVSQQVVTAWKKRGISRAGRYMIRDLARRKRFRLPDNFIPNGGNQANG